MDRCSEGARSLAATRASDLAYVESGPHRASTHGIEAAGNAILGGRLVRLAEAQESWNTGGEAGPEEDCVTDYE